MAEYTLSEFILTILIQLNRGIHHPYLGTAPLPAHGQAADAVYQPLSTLNALLLQWWFRAIAALTAYAGKGRLLSDSELNELINDRNLGLSMNRFQ